MDEVALKKTNIKEIRTCLEEIEYLRKNYIFEEELNFNDVKELDLLVGNLWLKYHKLYSKIDTKL